MNIVTYEALQEVTSLYQNVLLSRSQYTQLPRLLRRYITAPVGYFVTLDAVIGSYTGRNTRVGSFEVPCAGKNSYRSYPGILHPSESCLALR